MALRKYYGVAVAADDATTCTQPVWKFILTDILLKISQINLLNIWIQEIGQNKNWTCRETLQGGLPWN